MNTMPLHIVYVTEDSIDEDILEKCAEKRIRFTSRSYDTKYSDDRQNITSLPAMHLYINKAYETTLYPTHTLFDTIDWYCSKYEHDELTKSERQERWKNTISRYIEFFNMKNTSHSKKNKKSPFGAPIP
jgi:bisphosphoglycerate-dependent phosphoglycerate mutase